jgi:hypothetical protein
MVEMDSRSGMRHMSWSMTLARWLHVFPDMDTTVVAKIFLRPSLKSCLEKARNLQHGGISTPHQMTA